MQGLSQSPGGAISRWLFLDALQSALDGQGIGEALAAAFTLHVADLFYRGCFMTGSWLGHGCVTASLANDGVFVPVVV